MTKREFWLLILQATLTAIVIVLALGVAYPWLPASVRAAIKLPPPFDFNDDFYHKNGICLDAVKDANLGCQVGINNLGADSRVGFFPGTDTGSEFGTVPSTFGGTQNWFVDTTNTDPTRGGNMGGIRAAQTTGGFD